MYWNGVPIGVENIAVPMLQIRRAQLLVKFVWFVEEPLHRMPGSVECQIVQTSIVMTLVPFYTSSASALFACRNT